MFSQIRSKKVERVSIYAIVFKFCSSMECDTVSNAFFKWKRIKPMNWFFTHIGTCSIYNVTLSIEWVQWIILDENRFDYCQRWSRGHKARGQGHKKISRPRPRTDPLEAKAKNQEHRRKCSPKKKGLQKIFFRQSVLEETKTKVFVNFPLGFWRFPTKF